jgi:hypothetical protein
LQEAWIFIAGPGLVDRVEGVRRGYKCQAAQAAICIHDKLAAIGIGVGELGDAVQFAGEAGRNCAIFVRGQLDFSNCTFTAYRIKKPAEMQAL